MVKLKLTKKQKEKTWDIEDFHHLFSTSFSILEKRRWEMEVEEKSGSEMCCTIETGKVGSDLYFDCLSILTFDT